jgi:hypothetical protein
MIDKPAGRIMVWVDNVLTLDKTGGTGIGTGAESSFKLGENQNQVTGAGAADYYTDYDDIEIDDAARIGPISGGGGPTVPPLMAAHRRRRMF